MSHPIELALLVAGAGLALWSLKYRSESGHRFPIWNPLEWRPYWRMQDEFRGPGFALHGVGITLILAAALLAIARRFLLT